MKGIACNVKVKVKSAYESSEHNLKNKINGLKILEYYDVG